MKIWISCDMEGVAGIVDWDQCRPGGDGYALGCALMQDEVNAAIEGAMAGGATEFVVNDSHSRMANLDPRKIAGTRQLPVRPAQADVHGRGARRQLRRCFPGRLPRLDLGAPVDAVAHL